MLSLLPPYDGLLQRLGNLFIIGGTACIASGVIMSAKMVRHSIKVVEQEDPLRHVTRAELVEILGEVVADMQQKRSLDDVQDELRRRRGVDQLPDEPTYSISPKNVAQAFLKSSYRTYVGSALIIAGTILLGLEQFARLK